MLRVLVAVDDTEESVRAAEAAHRLFGDQAEFIAVSVAELPVDLAATPWGAGWGAGLPIAFGSAWSYRAPGVRTDAVSGEAADDAAEDARSVADRSGLTTAETFGEVGDPAGVVLRVAEDRAVDVIVLGTHERAWFDRLVRPSVSKDVVKRAEIPVLIVK